MSSIFWCLMPFRMQEFRRKNLTVKCLVGSLLQIIYDTIKNLSSKATFHWKLSARSSLVVPSSRSPHYADAQPFFYFSFFFGYWLHNKMSVPFSKSILYAFYLILLLFAFCFWNSTWWFLWDWFSFYWNKMFSFCWKLLIANNLYEITRR